MLSYREKNLGLLFNKQKNEGAKGNAIYRKMTILATLTRFRRKDVASICKSVQRMKALGKGAHQTQKSTSRLAAAENPSSLEEGLQHSSESMCKVSKISENNGVHKNLLSLNHNYKKWLTLFSPSSSLCSECNKCVKPEHHLRLLQILKKRR